MSLCFSWNIKWHGKYASFPWAWGWPPVAVMWYLYSGFLETEEGTLKVMAHRHTEGESELSLNWWPAVKTLSRRDTLSRRHQVSQCKGERACWRHPQFTTTQARRNPEWESRTVRLTPVHGRPVRQAVGQVGCPEKPHLWLSETQLCGLRTAWFFMFWEMT
jgi:hypothetical protein